ncbi:MAG: 50S ribosomal protein L25/general stress protein Ctc [Holosporaceae bacterium]|jgi:large subunit ribosomal protein L25|nr:50S ribosomal protein L25/general stress protein Ctc [Holosporaceae bacterium]
MSTVVLEAKYREKSGTGAARFARKEGFIPCVIYGDAKDPESICIAKDLVNRYVHRSNFFSTVFEMNGVGKKGQKFVAKDIQFHPVTDLPLHIDFMRVGKGSKVSVRVPLVFVNELASPGLKLGGVLNVLVHDIDVACDPENIPEKIEIDLTGFEFHHTVHAHDVKLPENIHLPVGCKNFTIATVVAPTIMKKEATEETAAATTTATATTTPSS